MQRNIYNSFLTILFVAATALNLKAQDAFFTQYYASPLQVNPAMMGVFQGQWRMNANYRQQWGGIFSDIPIRTIHGSFDYRLRVVDEDYLAFGINAMQDETGAYSKLKSTRGNLGISYMKQLSGNRYRADDQYLVAGIQVGTGQYRSGIDGLWFDRQYDSVAFNVNTSLASGEVGLQSNMFLDYTAGLMWYMVADDNMSFYIGASAHHLSSPNISFFGNKSENLRRRFNLNMGGELPLSDELSILPSMMASIQGQSMMTQFGTNFRYSNHDWQEVAIRVGGAYRLSNKYSGILGDAFTITGMLEMNGWVFGASYDIHTSTILRPTNGRGAWELSLIYVAPERFPVKTSCPKF
ncbi:MAG: PorP/SprF family type IX secretion system membrane protein [Saprospiraceae bacterium]|nr:PorP/SprF family type IX secretion system membrane protein [Saprospiraceae bacterium]